MAVLAREVAAAAEAAVKAEVVEAAAVVTVEGIKSLVEEAEAEEEVVVAGGTARSRTTMAGTAVASDNEFPRGMHYERD